MKSDIRIWIILAAILSISFVMYLPSLSNQFLWDDHTIIEDNPAMRMPNPFLLFGETYWPPTVTNLPPPYYRPMTMLWFWLEFNIFGKSAFGFRILNIFLFLLTAILVFYFARKIFQSAEISLFAAAVFALNPIHIESVAFVSGMTDVSAAFFIMLAIIAFSSEKWWIKYIAAPAIFLLSLFSKESAVAGILIFPAYELFIRRKSFFKSALSTLPFFVPMTIYFMLRYWVLGVFGGYKLASLNLFQKLAPTFYILVRYIQNIIFPFDLSPLHPQWFFNHSITYYLLWFFPFLILVGLLIYLSRNRYLRFSLFWSALFIIPALRIGASHQGALWAERFTYISSIGASLFIAFYIEKIFHIGFAKYKDIGKILVFTYFVLLFAFGFEYSFWWRNDWMGFRRIVHDAPEKPVGYSGLAEQFLDIGEVDSAFYYINMALEQDSTYPLALTTAADICIKAKKYEKSLEYCKKLMKLHPSHTAGYIYAAISSIMLGDTVSALEFAKKSTEIAPLNPAANKIYAEVLLADGDTTNALLYLKQAHNLLPDDEKIANKYFHIISKSIK